MPERIKVVNSILILERRIKRGETVPPSLFGKATWVALRKLLEKREVGYTFWGPKCLLGRLREGSSVSQLGVVRGMLPPGGHLEMGGGEGGLAFKEVAGMLNVLYCLGQSPQREISPAPKPETLFKYLRLTSQEATR